MAILHLLTTAFSCLLYGLVATAVTMAVLYIVLKCIGDGVVRTPVFWVSGVALFFLLFVQYSMLIGAVEAKGYCGGIELYVNQLVDGRSGTFDIESSQALFDRVTEQFPIVSVFLNLADFSGNDSTTIAKAMTDTMSSYLTAYIWHRVLWILAFVVIGCALPICYDTGKSRKSSGGSNGATLQF